MDPIEQEIVDALTVCFPNIAAANKYNDTDWSNAIKAILGAIGQKRNFLSWSGFNSGKFAKYSPDQIKQHVEQVLNLPVPNYRVGWLYDILWWEQDQNAMVTNIPLVVESEWGSVDSVEDDFQKLLVARSKYRIMIFQRDPDTINTWCKKQIHKYQCTQSNDRYLFCAWRAKYNRFDFESYIVP